ncbi:hypothetical protein SAMN05421766_104439 [Zobellia uliginosa]|uniref:Isochorismatase family protein n=1 Tax=Zobellia uliginosa TaxID=143224 RepID=A0ABY1L0W1_9FLAO|nr:hypothetical protein SAMN05421766_104439 [Zobellia uliginosa]
MSSFLTNKLDKKIIYLESNTFLFLFIDFQSAIFR